MTLPIGLWTFVLMPQIQHFDSHHFVFWGPEMTIFGQEADAVEEQGVDLTEKPQTLSTDCLSLKAAHHILC